MASYQNVMTKHAKSVKHGFLAVAKKGAYAVPLVAVSAMTYADPVTFTLTDANAQITAGAAVIGGVVGTIAAVAAVMKIGRWVIGFFR